ncbi:MAG: hypothetical protein DMF40_02525, partial [Verrucomicrobia bacterium]
MKSKFVSLHPYFKIHPGKLDVVKAGFPRFVEKTATEKATFSMNSVLAAMKFSVGKPTKTPKACW